MEHLGDIISEAIQSIPKMSFRKLEAISGVTRSEISLIIHKKRKRPTPQVLKKLAAPLNLDYTYLYTLVGYLEEEDCRRIAEAKEAERLMPDSVHEKSPPYPVTGRKKQEVFQMIRDLPDSEMEKVKEYLKLLQLKVKEEEGRQSK
jgi:transcriptional regulator with XRE-family HTH domain